LSFRTGFSTSLSSSTSGLPYFDLVNAFIAFCSFNYAKLAKTSNQYANFPSCANAGVRSSKFHAKTQRTQRKQSAQIFVISICVICGKQGAGLRAQSTGKKQCTSGFQLRVTPWLNAFNPDQRKSACFQSAKICGKQGAWLRAQSTGKKQCNSGFELRVTPWLDVFKLIFLPPTSNFQDKDHPGSGMKL
jgi:hypothetical protein